MSLTKVSPTVIAVTNNITSNTFGSANTIPSFQVDSSGVIVAASNTAINLTANSVANNQFQTGSIENYMRAQGSSSVFAGMRNRIINGAMVIDQRNAGASVTPTDNQYSLDRWHTQVAQSAKLSIQKMDSANSSATGYESGSAPAGFSNSLKVTSLSSYSVVTGDYFAVDQPIEAYNLVDLNWGTANAKTVTLSFWVKSSLTGTFGGAIANGAFNRSYPFTYTIVAANTWEQKFITIPGDTSGTYGTTNGRGVYVQFALGTGTTYSGTPGAWSSTAYTSATGAVSVVGTNAATWYLTGVQFEAGSSPTPFEYRQFTTELNLCQRYYTSYGGSNLGFAAHVMGCLNSSTASCRIFLPVKMRVAPTCAITGTINTDFQVYHNAGYKTLTTVGVSGDTTTESFRLDAQSSGLFTSGGAGLFYIQTTTGIITASAEL